jgi:hypothetical protein
LVADGSQLNPLRIIFLAQGHPFPPGHPISNDVNTGVLLPCPSSGPL